MKYFSFDDILYALLSSSLLGFIMGGVYGSLSTIISCTRKLLGVGVAAMRSPSLSDCRKASILQEGHSGSRNVYDFIFFACFGATHILLCYLTMDGVLRLYILVPSIITFIVSKNTVGAIFERLFICLYTVVYRISFTLLYLLTYPLRLICRGITLMLSPLYTRIVRITIKIKNNLLIRQKKRQIRLFFKSASKI